MFFFELTIILCFCLNSVTGQVCDTSSNTQQCLEGERCSNNKCERAVPCTNKFDCPQGQLYCRSDYCQHEICNSTGQCVHGQVCSERRDTNRTGTCAYRVLLDAEEGSTVTLNLVEPSILVPYDTWYIFWYGEGQSQIAYTHVNVGEGMKYNVTHLSRSYGRHKVNRTTGALTLINVTLEDEDFYYYELNSLNLRSTLRYGYRLKLNVTPSATIQGVSDTPVETGTKVTLTCTPVKVNTRFTEMYWVVGGRNESGTNTSGEGVLSISLVHEVTKEDEGNPVTCVVVPRFTDPITMEKYINPGYAPTGKPVIQVSTMGQYKGEKVTLTCENPVNEGNPPCNAYDWIKQGGYSNLPENPPKTQIYTFIMDELHQGNYTCQCSNFFGESEFSEEVETLYLGKRPEISTKDNRWLIAGCLLGVLVLAVLVVVAVFFCKKYYIKLNIQTNDRAQGTKKAGGKDNHVYETPIHDLKPTNTDYNNEYTEPTDRPESEITNKMPRHYITPLSTEDMCDYEEPVNRPESEMNQYDYINEDDMERPRPAEYVNTAFTTYEEVGNKD